MRDDQIFGVIASMALLLWLLGRRRSGGTGQRWPELAALALIGVGILYAVIQWLLWLQR